MEQRSLQLHPWALPDPAPILSNQRPLRLWCPVGQLSLLRPQLHACCLKTSVGTTTLTETSYPYQFLSHMYHPGPISPLPPPVKEGLDWHAPYPKDSWTLASIKRVRAWKLPRKTALQGRVSRIQWQSLSKLSIFLCCFPSVCCSCSFPWCSDVPFQDPAAPPFQGRKCITECVNETCMAQQSQSVSQACTPYGRYTLHTLHAHWQQKSTNVLKCCPQSSQFCAASSQWTNPS